MNALGKAVGRKRLDLPRANEFWKQLSYLSIFVIELSVDAKLLELAVRHALSVYDASYLALAVARQVPLASFDGKLLKAAESIGVQILRIQPPPAPIQ